MSSLKRETREQWGAAPPNGRGYVDKRAAQGVAVHYPGADTDYRRMSHAQHRSTMRAWQAQHMNRKSRDLEYGSVICPCGIWMEGRTEWDKPMVRVGSNGTSAANSTHTSVQLMIGTGVPISEEEKEWLGEAIAWLREQGWGDDVSPHSRFYATACPGDSVRNALPEITRIADRWKDTGMAITDADAKKIAEAVWGHETRTGWQDDGTYDKDKARTINMRTALVHTQAASERWLRGDGFASLFRRNVWDAETTTGWQTDGTYDKENMRKVSFRNALIDAYAAARRVITSG